MLDSICGGDGQGGNKVESKSGTPMKNKDAVLGMAESYRKILGKNVENVLKAAILEDRALGACIIALVRGLIGTFV